MDYLTLLGQLLPPGIALSPEQEETADLLYKTARELKQIGELDDVLFKELDPRNSIFLLDETEASLGLPDRCSTGNQTLNERQQAAYYKLTDIGGIRRTRYLNLLKKLGQPDATIERFTLNHCENDCETGVFEDTEWLFTWAVTLKESSQITEFTCQSHCDEALSAWGNTQIECVLNKEKPAYTHLFIKYQG